MTVASSPIRAVVWDLGGVLITPITHLLDEIATNSFKEFRELLEAHIDFGAFDVVVDSSEVGWRKPEPEIYALTTELLAVPAGEVLYLDDFEANLVGARAEGWRTIHVIDVADALSTLDWVLAAST